MVLTGRKHSFLYSLFLILSPMVGFGLAETVNLGWNSPSGAVAGYNVYRSEGGARQRLNQQLVSTPSFSDTQAQPGRIYRYTVAAVSSSGQEGAISAEVIVSLGQSTRSVYSSNSAPRAQAGSDLSTRSGETVVLDGEVLDPDGDSLTTSWTQISGPSVKLLSTENAARVTFQAPQVDIDTQLEFRLLATDAAGAESADVVAVLVRQNNAPELVLVAPSTVDAGDLLELNARATDPDGDRVTVSWRQSAGPALQMQQNGSSLSFRAPVVDTNLELGFDVEATDGLLSTHQSVRVLVRDRFANTIVFPVSPFETRAEGTFVGVGLVNAADQQNPVSFYASARHGSGREVGIAPLPAKSQVTFMASQLASPGEVSVSAQAQNGPIQALFLMGDEAYRRLDGIGGEMTRSRTLHFLVSRDKSNDRLTLFLNNPDDASTAQAHIEVFDDGGVLVLERSAVLAPAGSYLKDIDQELPSSFRHGYVKVTSDRTLRGSAMKADEESLETVAGQSPSEVAELLIPHFYVGPNGGDTTVRLFNGGDAASSVTILAFDSNGVRLGERSMLIAPQTVNQNLVSRLFGFASNRVTSGYLRVQSAGAHLIGNASFKGNGGKFATTLALSPTSRSDETFLHVAQSDEHGLFSGLSLLNATEKPAPVTATVYDQAGVERASVQFEIPAGHRRIDLLNGPQFFGPGFQQLGGYLRIKSQVPTVAMFLIGDYKQEFLTALEGQASH